VKRYVLAAAALTLAVALPSRGGQAPRRDLSIDEQRGGHTLTRHVGRTDDQLRQRLRDQPNISAASTYPDRETAELVVGRVLVQSTDTIRPWTRRQGSRPNLALRTSDPRGPPVGRVLDRGARTPTPARGAVVVLRWDQRRGSYYVLTSYPENR
jgi:Bacterial CdiA-CT RNAse A domain